MPSLKVLGEFKSSFNKLGGESEARIAEDLAPDDLPLPDHEPEPAVDAPAVEDGSAPADTFPADEGGMDSLDAGEDGGNDFIDLGDLVGSTGGDLDLGSLSLDSAEPEPSPEGAEEMGTFLDSIPNDPGAETPGEEAETSEADDMEIPGGISIPEEDTGIPDGLLDGLAGDIEAERASGGDSDFSADFDLGELPGFSDDMAEMPDEPAAEPSGEEPPELSGEEPPEPAGGDSDFSADFDLGELPDFSDDMAEMPDEPSGEEPPELSGEEPPEPAGGEPLEIPAGQDADFADARVPAPADEEEEGMPLSLADDTEGFDLDGETLDLNPGEASGGDSFDNFSLNTDTAVDFNLTGDFGEDIFSNSGFGDDFANLEEFSLPGLDDPFPGRTPKAPTSGAVPPHAPGTDAQVMDEREALGEVEEIQLSDEEYSKLCKTLASYPLNLRIACEQLIAEEAVAPDLMSKLIKFLVRGAPAKESAALAGKILGRTISIPKAFEKKTGEELEAEQASFAYIFVHNFLPVFRLFLGIALVVLSMAYLVYNFVYLPFRAESIYKLGLERIRAGEYGRANDRFREAWGIHKKKDWFYRYAEAFTNERQYIYAEEKYDELLYYTASKNKKHIPEKKAVMDYAALETYHLRNYAKADSLLRRNILDYSVWDRDALLAVGDNNLLWGETEPLRLEDAREAYAKIIDRYGQSDPLLERMLKYFIRTDNLGEVLSLQAYFMYSEKRKISTASLSELGGYLLDKSTEEIRGVPNEYLEDIRGIREILLRAVRTDHLLPESYYHLSRYYEYFNNPGDERLVLERALQAFDIAKEESSKRLSYHIDALRRYAEILINNREFFPAEEYLIKGANLYEDGLSRRLLTRSPQLGKLYAGLGDLEYFVGDGDMNAALDYYERSRDSGYAPPEILYRMGSSYYQLRRWQEALQLFYEASRSIPFNRRILYALGNAAYLRGDYYTAQGYYSRLLEILEADRSRFPLIMPTDNEEQLILAERLMVAQNNMAVVLEALNERTGNNSFRSGAEGLYVDSERAWDVLSRNPTTMIRMRPSPEINAPGVNPAYLNIQNMLYPVPGYERQFFMRIDKDILEPSAWEQLSPAVSRLSEGTL
jgi:tetratricopeptide (TPR) repeat protein